MDNYLEHHGIKGQKWGIRRFQNPDGTLTPLGRRKKNKLYKYLSDKDLATFTNRIKLENEYLTALKNDPTSNYGKNKNKGDGFLNSINKGKNTAFQKVAMKTTEELLNKGLEFLSNYDPNKKENETQSKTQNKKESNKNDKTKSNPFSYTASESKSQYSNALQMLGR